jgi:hypothetical protein
MMRNFMMSGAFSKARKPEGDPGREGHDTHSRGSIGHDNIQLTLPPPWRRYTTS